jgi:hypothetical protein
MILRLTLLVSKMSDKKKETANYNSRLENAKDYGEIWEVVKETAKHYLGQHRAGMMLFLDDLSLSIGAYHPLGTNNIVLNRTLVQIAEAATNSRKLVNSFIYILLLHEYLHALGYVAEEDARRLVYEVSKKSFGEDSLVSKLAEKGPWELLKGIPLNIIQAPKRIMEIVKDFEKTNQKYIS